MGIIYKATNTINNKTYIGMTTKSLATRRYEHETKRGSILLKRAIKKYGKSKISWKVLKTFETNDFNFLGIVEKFYIKKYDSSNKGYNLTIGGEGCMLGKNHPSFGKPVSEETRKKISIANKGKPGNLGNKNGMYGKKGIFSPNYGKSRSEKTKEKISKALKGRTKFNDPARKKAGIAISKSLLGRTKKNYPYIERVAKKLSKGTYISPFGIFYSINDVFIHKDNFLGKSTLIRFYKKPNKIISVNSRYRNFRMKTPKKLGFNFIGKDNNES